MTVRLHSDSRMSNRQFHLAGKPKWWARIGSGDTARFLSLPDVRGDEALDCEVDVPDGTRQVAFGVGPKDKGIRQTVSLSAA